MARPARTQLPQPVFHEPIFGEDGSLPDPTGFSTAHPSDTALYQQIGDLAKKDVVAVPKSRIGDDKMFDLAEAYGSHGPQIVKKITGAGKIVFHSLGDSGASNAGKYANEMRVADQVTLDTASSPEGARPAFLFHLGDIVYNFGEARYYYDQFYEPFRNYPAPIFAIPGNHDSFVVPGTKAGDMPLDIFQRNFCSRQNVITPEAGSLHRTAMTQPGVYFTLDAPFVRIIGLFSNALGAIEANQAAEICRRGFARHAPPAVQLLASGKIGRHRRQSRLQYRHAPANRQYLPGGRRVPSCIPVGSRP
jgi:hypothetical protein